MKEHEQWWRECIPFKLDEFSKGIGGINARSRRYARSCIKKMHYASILDCGGGLCTEHDGMQKACPELKYTAIDITPKFVEDGKVRGVNIIEGSIENIPFPDNAFDIAYVRHILEHLEYYERAINECMRVCTNETLIIFFKELTSNEKDNMLYDSVKKMYENAYSKPKLARFLRGHKDIKFFYFDDIDINETMLRIFKKIDVTTKWKIRVHIHSRLIHRSMIRLLRFLRRTPMGQQCKRIYKRFAKQ